MQKYSNYWRQQKKKLIEGSGGGADQNNVDGLSLWRRVKAQVDVNVAIQIDRNLWSSLRAPAWHRPAWHRVQTNTTPARVQRNTTEEPAERV